MSDIPDSYNNTLNQSENQDYLSIFDNKAEKLSLSLFIKSHLSDESYLAELDLSRDKLEFLTSPFDEGKQSGLQTLKNIIMAMLTGTDSRPIIPAVTRFLSFLPI